MSTSKQSVVESKGSSPDPKKREKEAEAAKVSEALKVAETLKSDLAPVGTTFTLKTGIPDPLKLVEPAFAPSVIDDLSAGNHAYTVEMKEKGKIGNYFDRDATAPDPTYVPLNLNGLTSGIYNTVYGALMRYHNMKNSNLNLPEAAEKSQAIAVSLMTDGEHHTLNRLKRPRVSADLPIPTPFAFAIQQLGYVDVDDFQTDLTVVPLFPDQGHTYGIPHGHTWNNANYLAAVEYARSLGMRFAVVDLKVKQGSAWWLFRQHFDEDVFELQCPLPEINFTESMAVTHTLFLNGDRPDPTNEIADIQAIGTDNYGTMMTNPHIGIHLNTYGALSNEATDIWTNV